MPNSSPTLKANTSLAPFYDWVVAESDRLYHEEYKLNARAAEIRLLAKVHGSENALGVEYASLCMQAFDLKAERSHFPPGIVALAYGKECPDFLPDGLVWEWLWERYLAFSKSSS